MPPTIPQLANTIYILIFGRNTIELSNGAELEDINKLKEKKLTVWYFALDCEKKIT